MVKIVDINAIKAEREKITKGIAKDNESVEQFNYDIPTGSQPQFPNREAAEAILPDLKEMNAQYAFIHNYGGKPAIKTMRYSELHDREIVDFMAIDTLYAIYMNRVAKEAQNPKGGGMSLGKWWMIQEHRKEYVGVTFEPDKAPGEYSVLNKYKIERAKRDDEKSHDVFVTYFNVWEGLGIVPIKGCWKKMRKHIYAVFCNKDKRKFKYVIKWMAWAVQNPGKRAEVALIFKGKKGAGKGVILKALVQMFGAHGMTISNREHLTGKHNQHLARTSLLYADEAYYPGDKEVEGILKNLITEDTLTTEPKFKEVQISRNCLHIVMSTNADWIIPATVDERRYFINEVDDKYARGGQLSDYEIDSYFNKLYKERFGTEYEKDKFLYEGTAAMLHDLLKIDLTDGWHPRNSIPETEELRKQIAMSLSKLKYAILHMLEDGVFPGSRNGKGELTITSANMLDYIHSLDPSNKTITSKSLAGMLKEIGVTLYRTGATRGYVFPELGIMRQNWSERVMKNTEWRLNELWEIDKSF
jgi:hypothetical protein